MNKRLLLGCEVDGSIAHLSLGARLNAWIRRDKRFASLVLSAINGGSGPAGEARAVGAERDVPRCAMRIEAMHDVECSEPPRPRERTLMNCAGARLLHDERTAGGDAAARSTAAR